MLNWSRAASAAIAGSVQTLNPCGDVGDLTFDLCIHLLQATENRARRHRGSLQPGQQQHGRHDGGADGHEGQPSDRRGRDARKPPDLPAAFKDFDFQPLVLG